LLNRIRRDGHRLIGIVPGEDRIPSEIDAGEPKLMLPFIQGSPSFQGEQAGPVVLDKYEIRVTEGLTHEGPTPVTKDAQDIRPANRGGQKGIYCTAVRIHPHVSNAREGAIDNGV